MELGRLGLKKSRRNRKVLSVAIVEESSELGCRNGIKRSLEWKQWWKAETKAAG